MGRRSTRVTFDVPAGRRGELVAELWALGTNGIEETREGASTVLLAYFEAGAEPSDSTWEEVAGRCAATLIEVQVLETRDWLAAYRAECEPITVGSLVIDPREPTEPALSGCGEMLRIPARNAFGTGSHESTRLILEALVDIDLTGRSVLDVGTGSAILALVALRRGARRAVGFDIDVGSVVTARDNARLNGQAPALFVGEVEALAGEFDVVLVNILPHRWLDQASAVVGCLRAGGELLVSGLLAVDAEVVLAPLRDLGMKPAAQRDAGEWASFRLRARTADAG